MITKVIRIIHATSKILKQYRNVYHGKYQCPPQITTAKSSTVHIGTDFFHAQINVCMWWLFEFCRFDTCGLDYLPDHLKYPYHIYSMLSQILRSMRSLRRHMRCQGRCAGPAHHQLPHLGEPLLSIPAAATLIRYLIRSFSVFGYKELHKEIHKVSGYVADEYQGSIILTW